MRQSAMPGHTVTSLSRTGALGVALEAVAKRRGLKSFSMSLIEGASRQSAAVDEHGRIVPDASANHVPIRAGCLAKPLTARLVAEAIAEHRVEPDEAVSSILGVSGAACERLEGVTIFQLLCHTHGLDGSSLSQVPRDSRGFLDTNRLCEGIAVRRLSAPGELYSYSEVGAWLAGAVLERVYGTLYGALLRRRGWIVLTTQLTDICPATGGELLMRADQWLDFLQLQFADASRDDGGATYTPKSLPGWSLFETGVCFGWKCYGGGWLGHNSNLPESSAVLRFQPDERVAIVVSAAEKGAAALVLADVLRTALPEFASCRVPRLLAKHDPMPLALECTGEYARAAGRLLVTSDPNGCLYLTVRNQEGSDVYPSKALLPAEFELFMPQPADDPDLLFLQFLRHGQRRVIEYIWNGRQLWRRD